MKIKKGKIIKDILKKCFYAIICIFMLYNIVFSIRTTISKDDYLKVFGISFFNMENNLMKDDIDSGDIVITKAVDEKILKEGDIIAYTVNGKTRINKILRKRQDSYTTKSNQNYYPDIEEITYNQIIGKVIANISALGFVFSIAQSKITTGIILICLVIYFLRNKYLFTKMKKRKRKKNSYQ